ncbi:MAG: flavin-dependent oxidoreductase [Actinomycetota bacterium]|nr:flavin-dependent oxidoreductase [Actinomycetota bacterium]
MPDEERVLLAGGGIGGLVAALCLHRAGREVVVFEAVGEPRELGVGINLLPHSVRVLEELGLGDVLSSAGVKTAELRLLSEDGVLIWSEPRGLAAGSPWPQVSIHRGRLQMLLLEEVRSTLGADRVLTGRRLTAFEQSGSEVTVQFADPDGTEIAPQRGALLVGCDGLHSAVRRALVDGDDPLHHSGLVLWRGAVELPPYLDGRTMFMAGDDRQKVVVYPIRGCTDPGGTVLVNWVAERPAVGESATIDWNVPVDPAEIAPWYSEWDFGWIHLGEMIAASDVAYVFPMVDRHPLERWSHGRVTLLGDAAHPMRPNGSNGASQAILDAEALAKALSTYADPKAALVAYEAERREATSRLVLANRRAGPESVMQWVADRCDGGCGETTGGRHVCVPYGDLTREANAYKELAGFDTATLRTLADNGA